MKYFYDTEFLEGTQKTWIGGKTKPTIDLISIGVVCEDGREYYAISKDFNLKEAWNRYDVLKQNTKVYWIRENVLKPIYYDWVGKDINFHEVEHFTYKNFKRLLKKYGKSNEQIVKEIKNFCYSDKETRNAGGQFVSGTFIPNKYPNIELYGYYSAYDHVVLSWLFGNMIDLPKGFPMYTIDLKQTFDEKQECREKLEKMLRNSGLWEKYKNSRFIFPLSLKDCEDYPKQENEHNALSDAIFVKNLYHFLKKV